MSDNPTKILFEISDIRNDSSRRETSFNLSNNSDIRFTLYCHPNCNLPEHDGKFTLIYLYLESSIKQKVSIQYRLSIVKNDYVQEGQETFLTAANPSRYGGLYKIEQNVLLNLIRRLNIIGFGKVNKIEKFTICCEINEIEHNIQIVNFKKPIHNLYRQNFQDLLESGKYADAVLFVGGKELKIHKNILAARSKVFSAMFEHDCVEKRQNRIEITDIQLDVCEELLRYIYTAKIECMDKLAVELLVASDKYGLEELKNGCEGFLKEYLSIETAAEILMLADLHQAKQLKAKCIDFISENAKKVQNTRGWKTLTTKADLITELFVKVTDRQEELKSLPRQIYIDGKPRHRISLNLFTRFLNYSENKLKNDFGALIENEKFSDTVFVLENGELTKVKVHKNILAVRSKEFAAMFERESDKVELPDVSAELCRQLLRHIYADAGYNCGNFQLDKKYADQLLILSEKYKLDDLKFSSELLLSHELEIETVSSTLLFAEMYKASYLKEECFDYITENCRKVTQTEEWKNLAKTKPELAVQLYEIIAAKQWC